MTGRPPSPARLPAESSSFVGRKEELARIGELLGRARLVTLTGPGGVGKTRVAVRTALAAAAEFPGGVHVVPLSALREPHLLGNTVAGALDLPEQSGRPGAEVVAEHLAGRRALLVLDT